MDFFYERAKTLIVSIATFRNREESIVYTNVCKKNSSQDVNENYMKIVSFIGDTNMYV